MKIEWSRFKMKWVPVSGAEVIRVSGSGEDEESDVDIAEHGELLGLLDEAGTALGESRVTSVLVLDQLYLKLLPPHSSSSLYDALLIASNGCRSRSL